MLKNLRQLGKNTEDNSGVSKKDAEAVTYSINDPLEKNRLAAIAVHENADELLQLAQTDNSKNIKHAATRRYAQVLRDDEPTRSKLNTLLANNRELFFSVTAQSQIQPLRDLGFATASTDADYLSIAENAKSHDLRATSAEKIVDLALIDQCWRKLKTKDKAVAKELKAKLDLHKEQASVETEKKAAVDKIVDEMDKLANSEWQPSSINRFELFSLQWQSLEFAPDTTSKSRYETLYAAAKEKADSWRSKQSTGDQQLEIVATLEETLKSIQHSDPDQIKATASTAHTTLTNKETAWEELQQKQSAPDAQDRQYTKVSSVLRSELKHAKTLVNAKQLINREDANDRDLKAAHSALAKLKDASSFAEYKSSAELLAEQLNVKVEQKATADAELRKQIHKQLRSLDSAVKAKRWGPAKSIQQRVEKKISKLHGKDKKSYQERVEKLAQQVKELGDWKEFASTPKLIELCDQMEKLPSLKLNPNDCANRIKDLQTQWKAMGVSPSQEKHWPRFKQAADIAYAPCAEYFSAKKDARNQKLKARKEICELLERYEKTTNWSEPDWRLVEKTIRTAKTEWKANQVFDRKRGKALDERFTKILNLLDGRLAPSYDEAVKAKSELIERVRKIAEEEDINQHTINQVKSIQSAWRLTGVCKPRDDRKLWSEFSAATKVIFDKFHGKKREQQAAGLAHVTRGRDIIKELFSISKSNDPVSEKQLAELQTEYSELAEFPERDYKKLSRDYQKALDAIDRARQKTTDRNRELGMQTLQHNADLCMQLETLVGESTDTLEAMIDAIETDWQTMEKFDNPAAAKALDKRKQSIIELLKTNKTPDYDANTEARRLLCIELEILCDIETPAEDKPRRMQYQLEKLQAGLQSSSQLDSKEAQLSKLRIEWLTAPPADPTTRDNLESRFQEALGKG